ncbi:hypothetical protein RO3G_09372 [Rhizopus delemar RA 99-880]|uniref:Uncharacterized protein n=1 Tax=Rhizopus delemar (strain RA 99-880 / ATCC MYA-4621 / FGSC 9543 / NRRL 43880) TaxID=246409 RepID=I1C882_RHIO9|nr:hypothetical protein RO3G_09372 [Rhizopus delemar RA 99-880]|eukprot:EIE84662.1 hypothetical protein RO3G_09372 [Rhizopus delemar RA 99-880]
MKRKKKFILDTSSKRFINQKTERLSSDSRRL